MKALLIAVTVAGMATACTDAMQPVPEPTSMATNSDTTACQYKPTLHLDVPAMGKAMHAHPHKSYDLVEYYMGSNVVVGKAWMFSNEDSTLTATICWHEAEDSISLFNGNIGNTTYILNLDRSTMNICHGPQETPVTYRLLINNSANLPTR